MIENLVKLLMNYASNIIEKVLPDEPTEQQIETIANTTLVTYAACKGFGNDIVADTENTYDDKAIEELIDSCEKVAIKYNFSLDPQDWDNNR